MDTATPRRSAGLLLIVVPLAFTALFTFLQVRFEYPAILRQPTAAVLGKFQAGGPSLIAAWYGLALTAILFVPIAVLLHRVLAAEHGTALLWLGTTFGVIAGVAQALGFLRWPFVVPYLAQLYGDPTTSAAQREAAAVVFEAFHRYAGMAVGEHLGYLATSVWTGAVALTMLREPLLGRRLGLSGMALALGVATGLLEPFGVPAAGAINAISYLLWALWLVIVGSALLWRRLGPQRSALSAPAGR